MASWQCVQNCGACCHLAPEDRPNLAEYLSPAQHEQYLSLVGEDGWCIHYDRTARRCQIYETRPRFCRVQADTFAEMYGVLPAALDDFAIACCQEQIGAVYGDGSAEWQRYRDVVLADE